MKKNFFFLLLLGIFVSQGMIAANKIVGGSMETTDQASWLTPAWNHGIGIAEFGYKTDKPLNGEGGCFHIQGTGTDVQYAIYQLVELKAGVTYSPNAAVKIVSGNATRTTWFEVFVGPTDPTTVQDYAENTSINQIKVASYFAWDKPPVTTDGLLSNGNTYKTYTPTADGVYYVVFKFGCNAATGNFEFLLDNVALEYSESPKATFKTAGFSVGIAPFEVEFLNTSVFATSYSWDFGNGETSTDKNPATVFEEPGTYNVRLTVSNGTATDETTYPVYVVDNVPGLPKKEKLANGDMETQGNWFVSWLDGQLQPTLTWGYTEETVTGGAGGSLNVNGDGGNRKNMCIYQPVILEKNHTYRFNAAFKALEGSADGMWIEVYLTNKEQPSTEYRAGSGKAPGGTNLSFAKEDPIPGCMGYIPTAANITGSDGLFSDNLSVITYQAATEEQSYPFERLTYIPQTTGMYFFILKLGGNQNKVLNLLFDNLSLSDDNITTVKQVALEDGCTIYAESGVIHVNAGNEANNAIGIYNVGGLLIQSDNFSGQFVSKALPTGLYIVKINSASYKVLVK